MEARETVHDLLAEARRELQRLAPEAAYAALQQGAVLIDTRAPDCRRRHGHIPGALHYPLSVLEWRVCPSDESGETALGFDQQIIVVCNEGYSSSLAAARLRRLGFHAATDLIDGFEGWKAAGLPVLQAESGAP